jgi:hypothetical protein
LNNVFDGFRRQARREEETWQRHGDDEQRSMAAKDAEIVEGICDTPH